jgi:hypothetical protein
VERTDIAESLTIPIQIKSLRGLALND